MDQLKWRSPTGPAFAFGERWRSSDGKNHTVTIVGTRRVGQGKFDFVVTYVDDRAIEMTKLVLDFRVRYSHVANTNVKGYTV